MRGHSKYLDDAYAAFVEDMRLAITRAEQYQGGMSRTEFDIVQHVANTLYELDPHARNIFPPRTSNATNVSPA
jgi:hypothetical protein